jgi:hypothetical protein
MSQAEPTTQLRAGKLWRMVTREAANRSQTEMEHYYNNRYPGHHIPPSRFMLWLRLCYGHSTWRKLLITEAPWWTPHQRRRFCQWLLLVNIATDRVWSCGVPELVVLIMEIDLKHNGYIRASTMAG